MIAARLCELINTSHEGNLTNAARDIGCSYDALRHCTTGLARGANLDMLKSVARYYGITVDSILTPEQQP